jgi:DNA-binding beta-propeller fold protein YncE
MQHPRGIVMSHKAKVFYVTGSHTIFKITDTGISDVNYFFFSIIIRYFSGMISVFAGSGNPGNTDGLGTIAMFNYPCGIAIDQQSGNLYVCDSANHEIRRITPQGMSHYLFIIYCSHKIKEKSQRLLVQN